MNKIASRKYPAWILASQPSNWLCYHLFQVTTCVLPEFSHSKHHNFHQYKQYKHRTNILQEWPQVVAGTYPSHGAPAGDALTQDHSIPSQEMGQLQKAQLLLWETCCRNGTRSHIMESIVVSEDNTLKKLASVRVCKRAAISFISPL